METVVQEEVSVEVVLWEEGMVEGETVGVEGVSVRVECEVVRVEGVRVEGGSVRSGVF